MGKLRQWFRKWFDRQVEKSFQRQANKLFEKKQNIKIKTANNTRIFKYSTDLLILRLYLFYFLLSTPLYQI